MSWIAPSEKDADTAGLEKCLWDAAEQAVPASQLAKSEDNVARPEGLLRLIFLRFTEVRFATQRASLKAEYNMPDQINHRCLHDFFH